MELTITPELIDLQHKLEQEALDRGAENYRKALERGEDTMPPGMKLIHAAVQPLTETIQAALDDALSGRPGRDVGVMKYLSQFEPRFSAFVAVKTVLSQCTSLNRVQTVAVAVAKVLEDSINLEAIKKADSKLYSRLLNKINKSPDPNYRHVVMRHAQNKAQIASIKWGRNEQLRLGVFLVHSAIEATGMFEIRQLGTKEQTRDLIIATEKTLQWLDKAHARCELMSPAFMPMVIPPLPWKGPRGGGFLSPKLQRPLIKTRNQNYLSEMEYWDMPMVLEAVNALQETPWAVNKAVLSVAARLWEEGGRIAKMPSRDPIPLPPKTFPEDTPNTEECVKEWKRKAAMVYEVNAKLHSKRTSVAEKLALAEKYAEFGRFYYPHQLDWRGRAYPVASHLNPQGDDLSKGLIQFAEGKPLDEQSALWLAVHGANCYGVDKVSFEERVKWVLEHRAEILDSAFNPLDGQRFWTKTKDNPFCFLAFCFEWAGYLMQGPGYVSHLAVGFDGSCNGLQNFSAMLRDERGGAAVNLVPSAKPSDIYSQVAKESQEAIDAEALQGHDIAQRWTGGKIVRRLTKRNTMTVPYSVSKFGMREQLLQEFGAMASELVEELENTPQGPERDAVQKRLDEVKSWGWDDAGYLAATNYESIGRVVVAARQAMDWLRDASAVAASGGLPVRWETPAGLLVLQDYRCSTSKESDFVVAGRRFRLTMRDEGTKLDTRKQAAGISPNFIHSLDAAHLMRTISYCKGAGMRHFAMIHDSYGAHAADAEELSYQLRRAFVDQYEGDVLGHFRDQLVEQLPEELAQKLPPLPPKGTLDLASVMGSEYFFA